MTRDQRWLLKVTQKPKFRWLKVLTQRVRNITSVINYRWCIILNKLHLLDRISYGSNGLETRNVTTILERGVTQRFKAVQCSYAVHLYEMEFSDVDYFQRGNKIVHVVKDIHNISYVMRLTLKDAALVLGGKAYAAPLPEIRATFQQMDLTQRPRHCGVSVVPEYRTVTYDLSKLRNLMCEAIVNDPENRDEIVYTATQLSAEMFEVLSKLSLSDLEVRN